MAKLEESGFEVLSCTITSDIPTKVFICVKKKTSHFGSDKFNIQHFLFWIIEYFGYKNSFFSTLAAQSVMSYFRLDYQKYYAKKKLPQKCLEN